MLDFLKVISALFLTLIIVFSVSLASEHNRGVTRIVFGLIFLLVLIWNIKQGQVKGKNDGLRSLIYAILLFTLIIFSLAPFVGI